MMKTQKQALLWAIGSENLSDAKIASTTILSEAWKVLVGVKYTEGITQVIGSALMGNGSKRSSSSVSPNS